MIVRYNGAVAESLENVYSGENIWLGIDSSKRNTAIAVGTETGQHKDIIELDGTQDGTTEYSYIELCKKQRDFLRVCFNGANITKVGIEDIITKGGEGIYQHQTRFAITAVFMSFLFAFEDYFNIKPELINNNTWKTTVLPAQYRSRDIKKGAQMYLRDINHWVGMYSKSDPADAYCILEYLYLVNKVKGWKMINDEPERHGKMMLAVGDYSISTADGVKKMFNPYFSFEVNCRKAIGDCDKAVMKIPVQAVPYKYIWTRLVEPFNLHTDSAFVYLEVKHD